MDTPFINTQQMNQTFDHLHPLADDIASLLEGLSHKTLHRFLWSLDGASPFTQEQFMKLRAVDIELWHLRLALAWDLFREHRHAALSFCREQLQAVSSTLPEWKQEEPGAVTSVILPRVTEASLLLKPDEEITTNFFLQGVQALAKLVETCLDSPLEDLSVGQQMWGASVAEKGIYKRLVEILSSSSPS